MNKCEYAITITLFADGNQLEIIADYVKGLCEDHFMEEVEGATGHEFTVEEFCNDLTPAAPDPAESTEIAAARKEE